MIARALSGVVDTAPSGSTKPCCRMRTIGASVSALATDSSAVSPAVGSDTGAGASATNAVGALPTSDATTTTPGSGEFTSTAPGASPLPAPKPVGSRPMLPVIVGSGLPAEECGAGAAGFGGLKSRVSLITGTRTVWRATRRCVYVRAWVAAGTGARAPAVGATRCATAGGMRRRGNPKVWTIRG